MKRNLTIALAVAAILLWLPAAAGGQGCSGAKSAVQLAGKESKCTEDAQLCLNHMAAKLQNQGWVGIELDADEATGGYRVTKVEQDSPALDAGLRAGDVLVALNGIRFAEDNHEALQAAKQEMRAGHTIRYTVLRNDAQRELPVTLARIPDEIMVKWIGGHMMQHVTVELAQR